MLLEVILLSIGLHAGSVLYNKVKDKFQTSDSTDRKTKSAFSKKKAFQSWDVSADGTKEQPEHLPAVRENLFSEALTDKYLIASSVSTALTAAGKIVYPPLIPIGILGLAYPFTDMARKAYDGLFKKRKLTVELVEVFLLPGMILTGYYFTASLSYLLFYLSQKLLNHIEDKTRGNLIDVFENQSRSVWIVKDGVEIEVPFDSLQSGDIVAIKAGETIPADGIITKGVVSVDQRILTGESQPLEKAAGEPVFASTVVLSGTMWMRVEKSGKETVVSSIADMLNRTVDFKTAIQSKGEKIADQSVGPTLAAAALAFPFAGAVGSTAVLLSYVGGDIRLFVPLSTLNFLKSASRNGILIKDGRALELLVNANTVVFDKTGTLTLEQPHVHHIHALNGYQETDILRYAAMAEHRQTHPIARAILEKADECDIRPGEIDDARYEIGYGIKVRHSNTLIRVGSARFMEMEGINISEETEHLMHRCLESGHSLVLVAKDDHLAGAIELHATVRPEVKGIISRLHKRGKSIYIITGDHKKPARLLAEKLGIENYFAETFPEQKAQIIEYLQKQGKTVCFIGDGINDSIAMKKAQVSVSLRGASTVATDTANIILMDGTLSHLDKLFELAEDFNKNIHTALALSIAPGIINIGSVFFLQTGIYFAMMLYYFSLPAGLANAFLPLITDKKSPNTLLSGGGPLLSKPEPSDSG